MAAAPSMAAALAASLPAPSSAPTPAAPVYEAIPASMTGLIDIEAEISISNVQLDGLVVTKIVKHGREVLSGNGAQGLLMGLDLDGTLEVSNSFPLPHRSFDDDDKSSKSVARYQGSMLRALKEVQSDDSVVGFYQATTLGAFFNQTLLETQAAHQDRLRQGGIVVVHDISPSSSGKASFRAFRLTPGFLDSHRRSNFTTTGLINNRLTFATILDEIPVTIRTNPLLSSFLSIMTEVDTKSTPPTSVLPPVYSSLDPSSLGVTKNLERISEAIDAYRNEENSLAFISRTIAREKFKADTAVQKRKEENATRVAQGLAPLPEEDISRLFKIPPEPSRLESLVILGQVDSYAKSLEETAGAGLVKMYATKACASI